MLLAPWLSRDSYEQTPNVLVVVCLQGSLLLIRQVDQPGIVAGVATALASQNINISFMSVGRTGAGKVGGKAAFVPVLSVS